MARPSAATTELTVPNAVMMSAQSGPTAAGVTAGILGVLLAGRTQLRDLPLPKRSSVLSQRFLASR